LTGENQFPPSVLVQVLTAAVAVNVNANKVKKIIFIECHQWNS
jgi:hypothetical protein